jgi:hypothetical protein
MTIALGARYLLVYTLQDIYSANEESYCHYVRNFNAMFVFDYITRCIQIVNRMDLRGIVYDNL